MPTSSTPSPFTTAERALIRYEFMVRFGQAPSLADGMWLKVWRSGPQKGQPKVPPAVATMAARGLVTIQPGTQFRATAVFTEAGMANLRVLAQDRRALSTEYDHLREELGVAAG